MASSSQTSRQSTMDLDDILGLQAGDFEGVEDDADGESDSEPLVLPARPLLESVKLPPGGLGNTVASDGESSVQDGSGEPAGRVNGELPGAVVQPTIPSGRSTNGGLSSKESSPTSRLDSSSVDAERGTALPEHRCGGDKALAVLRLVERCCLESRSDEIEQVVAKLSSRVNDSGCTADNDRNRNANASEETSEAALGLGLFSLSESTPIVAKAALSACRTALKLCQGHYEQLLRESQLFATVAATEAICSSAPALGDIAVRVKAFVVGLSADVASPEDVSHAAAWRAAEAMWAGAAALSLFFQENYTGPELGPAVKDSIDAWFEEKLGVSSTWPDSLAKSAVSGEQGDADQGSRGGQGAINVGLSCDGELPYPKSGLAASLLTARQVLGALALPAQPMPWSAGTSIADGSRQSSGGKQAVDEVLRTAAEKLSSAAWWSARACVSHARLLLSSDRSETLWQEALALFGHTVKEFGGGLGVVEGGKGGGVINGGKAAVRRRVAGQVWLEWGLAQHYFQDPSKGKASFARAKEASGLTATLTGALGKRTKHQQSQVAQLVLIATSASDPSRTSTAEKPSSEVESTDAGKLNRSESEPNAPQTDTTPSVGEATEQQQSVAKVEVAATRKGEDAALSRPEVGMSTAVGEGDDRAAARRIRHAEDSELLDDIGFVERELENPGKLEDIDLAIILGLCLDVSNSNPRDGLTNEEMTPYVARVLRQPGCNWMIYSTALLQRSWVEFERSHARDRSALQIQALLDQHTTKLTYTQSTAEAVEDSAPAQDRVRFLPSLSFPPRWELRRDLAQRYASMGVLGSAAEEFVDLEMWEEAVECYRQMQQIHRAEKIARGRLKEQETPPMWAALGDLTQDPECWTKAWDLSGGRYARAKVSLARHRFSEADYEGACSHFENALAVKPLLPTAWFTLGVARMRLGRWSDSLEAFSRVVQQEPEEGEAWGNMGAVHMHEGNWASASACFTEGLKHMPGNWRMWENHGEALIRMGKWGTAVYACHRMLDLSDKSKRGIDPNFLALLVEGTLEKEPRPGDDSSASPSEPAPSGPGSNSPLAASGSVDNWTGRPLSKQVAELLGRLVSSTRGDARIWEVYARFNEGAGRDRSKVVDCVTKQCRALQQSGWEKDADVIAQLASASAKLIDLYLQDGTRQSAYQAKMHLATAARKIKTADVCAGCPGHERVFTLLHTVEGVLAELKMNKK